jgi:NhaP-type Na+/H+ or K+/H+ antiporter
MMAGPMLIVATGLSALMMRYILGYDGEFTFTACLLYGAIISATDPVAVVSLLKELGASKKISTMIEGESLLNDGTAMVVFFVLLDMVEGNEASAGDILLTFLNLSGGGPILGIVFGLFVSFMLSKIHNNYVLEVNTTIVACYIMFYLAEFTALHCSGILALVALGLFMSYSGKTKISAESEHALHHVWGYVGFIAETLIFILSGVIIGERIIVTGL